MDNCFDLLKFKYQTLINAITDGCEWSKYDKAPSLGYRNQILVTLKIVEPDVYEALEAALTPEATDEETDE